MGFAPLKHLYVVGWDGTHQAGVWCHLRLSFSVCWMYLYFLYLYFHAGRRRKLSFGHLLLIRSSVNLVDGCIAWRLAIFLLRGLSYLVMINIEHHHLRRNLKPSILFYVNSKVLNSAAVHAFQNYPSAVSHYLWIGGQHFYTLQKIYGSLVKIQFRLLGFLLVLGRTFQGF